MDCDSFESLPDTHLIGEESPSPLLHELDGRVLMRTELEVAGGLRLAVARCTCSIIREHRSAEASRITVIDDG